MLAVERALLPDNALRNKLRQVPNGSVLYLPGLDYGNWYTGSIKDYSGNANHGTIVGATKVRLPSGLWGLSFDGDDYVTLPVVITSPMWQRTTNFTAFGWSKITSIGSEQCLIGLGQTVEDNTIGFIWIAWPANKSLGITVRDNTNVQVDKWVTSNSINLVSNTWIFWAVIQTGAVISFVINGVADAGIHDATGIINGASFNNSKTLMGARQRVSGYLAYQSGSSDLFGVASSALSIATLLNFYNQTRWMFGV